MEKEGEGNNRKGVRKEERERHYDYGRSLRWGRGFSTEKKKKKGEH